MGKRDFNWNSSFIWFCRKRRWRWRFFRPNRSWREVKEGFEKHFALYIFISSYSGGKWWGYIYVFITHSKRSLITCLRSKPTYFFSASHTFSQVFPPFSSTPSLKIASLQLPTDFLTQCLHHYRVAVGSRPHNSVSSNRHLILGTQRESSHDNISGGRVNGWIMGRLDLCTVFYYTEPNFVVYDNAIGYFSWQSTPSYIEFCGAHCRGRYIFWSMTGLYLIKKGKIIKNL